MRRFFSAVVDRTAWRARPGSCARLALLLAATAACAGCGAPEAGFLGNAVYRLKAAPKITRPQEQDIADALGAMFGSPDEPTVPPLKDFDVGAVLDIEKIKLAAGPVSSDENGVKHGLYREHCAHCHGVTGDGRGPTAAFLNPYPRDYRRGVYKFKSTPKGQPPTHDDLRRVLVNGVPGTAMPSFRLLGDAEIDALVHYVKYLSVRGQVERKLIDETTDLEEGARFISGDQQKLPGELEKLRGVASKEVKKWLDAPNAVVKPPAPGRPEIWDVDENARLAAVRRGRDVFYGENAGCVKCHGLSAQGDGQVNDFDEWTKEWVDTSAVLVRDLPYEKLQPFLDAGALPPRNIRPRNLRQGVFRGGRRPIDVFWRVHNGIDGTPMPGATLKPPGSPPGAPGLSIEDVWCLVEYVRQLPDDAMQEAASHLPENQRERM